MTEFPFEGFDCRTDKHDKDGEGECQRTLHFVFQDLEEMYSLRTVAECNWHLKLAQSIEHSVYKIATCIMFWWEIKGAFILASSSLFLLVKNKLLAPEIEELYFFQFV